MNWLTWNWSTARGKAFQCSFLLIKYFGTKVRINRIIKCMVGKNIEKQWESMVINLMGEKYGNINVFHLFAGILSPL